MAQEEVQNSGLVVVTEEFGKAFKKRKGWMTDYVPETATLTFSKDTYDNILKSMQEIATLRANLAQAKSDLRKSQHMVADLELDKATANGIIFEQASLISTDPEVKKNTTVKLNARNKKLEQTNCELRNKIEQLENNCTAQACQLKERSDQAMEVERLNRTVAEQQATIDQNSSQITNLTEKKKELEDEIGDITKAQEAAISSLKRKYTSH